MASALSSTSRGVKRVLQACENCRRKKTRCPGEKPRCSNCTRLRQTCRYPSGDFSGHGEAASSDRTLEDRLAQLEEKLDLVLDRPGLGASPRQAHTPHTVNDESRDETSFRSPITPYTTARSGDVPGSYSRLLPSWEVLAEAIKVYFRCSHRQPLWLFEPQSQLTTESSEELLLAVLGVSVQYGLGDIVDSGAQLQSPSAFNDAARSLIMLKIANSTVELTTLQSLCLLAMSNLVSGDVQLASFHTNLVSTLMQCSGLDMDTSLDRADPLEQQRRLFWSVQILKSMCGLPVKMPSTLDIKAPSFLVPDETLRKTSGRAPQLPVEICNSNGDKSIGIWAHMVRSASLWALVRVHVWRCAEGQVKPPWRPDSDYTTINSMLLDMECAFPISYRYDTAKFLDRSPEELETNREFWLPWMKIQISYHTLHSVLNHPFLYSSRVSKPKPGPNAFWKTSTDLALLHSTWIARLLRMAMDKGLELADPFFAHAAAVAVTLHLYWSRAADPKICTPAKENLQLCRTFISRMGLHWPLVRSIDDGISNLVQLATPEDQPQRVSSETPATVSDQISLMWKVLDFASALRSRTGQSLFQNAWETSLRSRASSHEQMMLEDPEIEGSPPGDFQTTAGNYAEPPDWFSPVTETPLDPPQEEQRHKDPSRAMVTDGAGAIAVPPVGPDLRQQNLTAGHPGWGWDPGSDANMFYDPFTQFQDRVGGPDTSWWDYGNL